LKNFCNYIYDNISDDNHVIVANEGNAIALAGGYHIATNKVALVYMQNSGIGNAVNPLTSLVDEWVYSIPLLLIIGWRGEPGIQDEPQHIKQGKITEELLMTLGIPFWILHADTKIDSLFKEVFTTLAKRNAPVALLVKKNTFSQYVSKREKKSISKMQREDALRKLLELITPTDLLISTTGKTSRELFELRKQRGEQQRDFLTVGSLGHTASIALGIAMTTTHKRVICLDGDGSMLMHMGTLPIIGSRKPENFFHVLLNNAAHESVGGHPTVAGSLDFRAIANACGYTLFEQVDNIRDMQEAWNKLIHFPGPVMLEIKINQGSRKDLGRPTSTPIENKVNFMEAVTAN
ncbi:MAG: phosphonopyruvate decarboxylase, partial [Candidatus Electrothrix sp. EH2]|nr:phosphonopyruvate decarboxylase [Candidatus Electrothrix sp. EH2]